MYNTLFERYKEWLTWPVYYLGLIFMIGLLFIKNKKIKLVSYSFLVTSIIYLVLTSKVLFFHEYYHHVMVITFILFASCVYFFTRINKLRVFVTSLFIVGLLLTVPAGIDLVNKKLSVQRTDILQVGEYLKENMDEEDFFIMEERVPTSLSIYSEKKSIFEVYSFPYNKELTYSIREDFNESNNLSEVMKKHKLKYYVTKGEKTTSKNGLIYLFYDKFDVKVNEYSERTIIILCKENEKCIETETLPNNYQEIFDKNIKPYLILEKQIGEYYLYRFY
jgi:hypothetical protein